MSNPHRTFCPLCNSTNSKILYKIESEEPAAHFFKRELAKKELLKQHIEKLWGQNHSYFLTCLDCSFTYASPFLSGDNKYYSIAYSNANYGDIWKFEFEFAFKDIERLIKLKEINENFKFLEIGAGSGLFISQIAKINRNLENLYCTEFSEDSISKIKKQKIKCWGVDIPEIKKVVPGIKFDVVCMFQVLEHLQDPNSVFKELNQLLELNGFLFIAVPNELHRRFFDSINLIEDLPPTHISRWNKNNLVAIGTRNGFKLQTFDIENTSYCRKFYKLYSRIQAKESRNLISNNEPTPKSQRGS